MFNPNKPSVLLLDTVDTQIRRCKIDVGIDLYWLRFSLASGDNFGTNSVDPDQARQSVKLIWIPSVRVKSFDTVLVFLK